MDLFESRLGWTWRLRNTLILQHAAVILFQYIASFREIVYNNSFNTGVLQWAK